MTSTASSGRASEGGRLKPTFRLAAMNGLVAAVQEQLRRGADVNATDHRWCSPLMLAAAAGHVETCRLLLDAGADPRMVDSDGRDALAHAVAHGRSDVAEFLNSYSPQSPGADAHEEPGVPLSDADVPGTWEVEGLQVLPPKRDAGLLAEALALNDSISSHIPINPDEEWDEVELELPLPVQKSALDTLDPDERALLRDFIEAALRSGYLPPGQLDSIEFEDDQNRNDDLRHSVRVVLGDVGVLVDESSWPSDCLDPSADFENPSDVEESETFEALDFLAAMWARQVDPLYLYRADIGGSNLLSREDEVALAQQMEYGVAEAIDGLSNWPRGLQRLSDSLLAAESGVIPLRKIVDADSDEPYVGEALEENGDRADDLNPVPDDPRSTSEDANREAVQSVVQALGRFLSVTLVSPSFRQVKNRLVECNRRQCVHIKVLAMILIFLRRSNRQFTRAGSNKKVADAILRNTVSSRVGPPDCRLESAAVLQHACSCFEKRQVFLSG
jgi:hypothetical protein